MATGQQAEYDDDEKDAGNVESADQQAQRADRLDAVAPDRKGHGAKRAQRGHAHDQAEGGEQHVREAVDAVQHDPSRAADVRQAEAAQHRQQQHRQHFALGKCAEEGGRNDVQHKVHKAHRRAFAELGGDGRVQRFRIDVHARAGLQHEDSGQARNERQNRQHVEQAHGLEQGLADLPGFAQGGDAADDGAKNNRRDHHLDELDKAVAQRLERRPELGPVVADGDAEQQADQDLDV